MSLGWTVAGAAALVVVVVALEWRRPTRAYRWARVVAVLLATISLAAIIYHAHLASAVPLTILTPGAPASAGSRDAVSLEQLPSLTLVARDRRLRLAGWGLLAHEWPDSAVGLSFIPAHPPTPSVVELTVPTEIVLGQPFTVSGAVALDAGDSTWVLLRDPTGTRDSAPVSSLRPRFRLLDRPRAAGAVTYTVGWRGMEAGRDSLGLAVRELPPPAVLVLDASPNFETRFLKEWLAQRGGRVTVHTTVSLDRSRIERVNSSAADGSRLTATMLAGYDVVLADAGALAGLGAAERAVLERAVRQDGLGLLLTADLAQLVTGANGDARWLGLGELLNRERRLEENQLTRPTWPDAPRRSRVAIATENVSIRRSAANRVLVEDGQHRALAGYRTLGAGKVGASAVHTPSRWLLEGETDLFSAYWFTLLSAIARDSSTRVAVAAEGPLQPDHPMTLILLVPMGGHPVAVVADPSGGMDTIALARDPFDSRRWNGRYWPRQSGWHEVRLGPSRVVPFRVAAPGEWLGLEATARRAATLARLRAGDPPSFPGSGGYRLLLAYLALLGALTWLWLEGRLSAGH